MYATTRNVAKQMANGIQPLKMQDNMYFHQESTPTKEICFLWN